MVHPTKWLNEFQVNSGTAATGTQSDPHIIGLSNGNFLVAWTEAANGLIGTTAGIDMIGKIFDAEGSVVRDSFQINFFRAADDEFDFDIAATNDGGFVLVYVDDDIAQVNQTDVVWERRDADGNYVTGAVIATENVAADFLANPQVTVNQLTSQSIVTYTDDVGANTDINFVTVSSTGTVSAEFSAAQNGADFDRHGDVAVLTNGNLVSVYEEEDVGVTSIELKIVTTSGVQVGNIFQTFGSDADPQVASLSGGGFVVAWDYPDFANGEIYFRIFNNSGTPISGLLVAASGANLQNEVEVVALPNGGFVIVWDDDTSGNLFAREYDATGIEVGSIQTIENVGATQPDIGVTGDGRILFTWRDVPAGEIFASVWDPRDATINAVDYQANLPNFVDSSVITTGLGSTTVNGDAFANTILGQGGNDTLFGGSGNDTINGGAGDDVIEGGGNSDSVNGGSGDDVIRILDGEFIDNVNGGPGTDVLDLSNVTSVSGAVNVNLTTGVFTGHGPDTTIVAIENVTGTQQDDIIIGNDSINIIDGQGGDDILQGGFGTDTIIGGAGTDTASYENASGAVTVDLHTRTTSGPDGNDTLISIENVIGSAFDDTLRGSAFAGDTIMGLGGNDTIVGRAGIDTMIGGDGDDSYFVQQVGDIVTELFGEGDDTVRVYFDNYTLTDNVEEGRVVGSANILFGNEFDNLLAGGGGADELHGGDGNDTLTGNGGGDTLFGDAGDDRLIGSAGADTLNGGADNDRLEGNADIDTMNGNNGDDVFFGGGGRDFMTGGLGADRFVFDDADFGGNSFATADRILDFSQAENDSIDLRPTDADTTIANDQAFTFIADTAFSGTAGELRFIQSGGRTYVQGDTDGDGNSDFMIRLEGLIALDAGDFLL